MRRRSHVCLPTFSFPGLLEPRGSLPHDVQVFSHVSSKPPLDSLLSGTPAHVLVRPMALGRSPRLFISLPSFPSCSSEWIYFILLIPVLGILSLLTEVPERGLGFRVCTFEHQNSHGAPLLGSDRCLLARLCTMCAWCVTRPEGSVRSPELVLQMTVTTMWVAGH